MNSHLNIIIMVHITVHKYIIIMAPICTRLLSNNVYVPGSLTPSGPIPCYKILNHMHVLLCTKVYNGAVMDSCSYRYLECA